MCFFFFLTKVDVSISTLDNLTGKYYETYRLNSLTFCRFLRSLYRFLFYNAVQLTSKLPPADECPVTIGNYYIADTLFNVDSYWLLTQEGHFRFDILLSHGNRSTTGIRAFASAYDRN